MMLEGTKRMRSRWGVAVVSAALLASLSAHAGVVATASPAPGDELRDPLGRGLVVRVSEDVPEGETIRGWIEQRGHEVLGERLEALEAKDLIRVAVRGGPYDYRITLQVRRGGSNLPEQPAPLICECSSEEMLARVGEAIDAAADRLVVAAAVERAAEAKEAERVAAERAAAQRHAVAAAGEPDERRGAGAARPDRYRSSPLGVAGIAVLSAGAASLVGGIGVTAAGAPHGGPPPGGLAMVGIGSTAFVSGMTMLIVDVVRCRRTPGRCVGPWRGAVAGRGSGPSIARRP
jgi:hypothetical protein